MDAQNQAWRREFPILRNRVYLVSHSMGAMPRGTAKWLKQYADEWREFGVEAWERAWIPRLRETAALIGLLFGAPPGTVALHQNVSTLVAVVLSAIFKPGGRRKVIYTDLNFPSIHYNFALHRELGLEVKVVKSPDGIEIPTEAMVDAIDDETLVVVIDHGIFRSGYLQDVAAIARAARKQGAFTLVDAYQTIGCVPIDVVDWGVDFLVGGSHKWLCGGPGAAYLYVRRDLIRKLKPRVTGWFSHARPFGFEWNMEFAPDAMRMATGTPNIVGIYAARAGIEMVAKVGPKRVRDKSMKLMQTLLLAAETEGLRIRSPRDATRRSGVLCLDFPGAEAAERALLRQGFQIDYRPRCGLRLSAHFYTTEDELLSILPAIRRLRRRA